MIEENSYQR